MNELKELIENILTFAERRLQTCEDWEMRYWAGYIDGVNRIKHAVAHGKEQADADS